MDFGAGNEEKSADQSQRVHGGEGGTVSTGATPTGHKDLPWASELGICILVDLNAEVRLHFRSDLGSEVSLAYEEPVVFLRAVHGVMADTQTSSRCQHPESFGFDVCLLPSFMERLHNHDWAALRRGQGDGE